MIKNFEEWLKTKTELNESHKRVLFQEREVWWCSIGTNIGDEQDGKGSKSKRPVIIFRKYSSNIFVAIPLSTKIKDNLYNYIFDFKDIKQCALLSQARIADAKRLSHKMGRLPKSDYLALSLKFQKLLFGGLVSPQSVSNKG